MSKSIGWKSTTRFRGKNKQARTVNKMTSKTLIDMGIRGNSRCVGLKNSEVSELDATCTNSAAPRKIKTRDTIFDIGAGGGKGSLLATADTRLEEYTQTNSVTVARYRML